MGAPQITYLIISALGVGIVMTKHGEGRTDKYNFWTTLLGILVQIGIMYWGGFFG